MRFGFEGVEVEWEGAAAEAAADCLNREKKEGLESSLERTSNKAGAWLSS